MSDSKLKSKLESLAARLDECFGASISSAVIDRDELTIVIARDDLLNIAARLCGDEEFAFAQLSDLSGIDYLTYGQADWQTRAATDTGFSRGVSKATVDLENGIARAFRCGVSIVVDRTQFAPCA